MKKYFLSLSVFTCLLMGALFAKPIISWFYPSTFFGSVHALYLARDLTLYSQEANTIIVGEVREVSAAYLREDRGNTSQQNIQIDVKEVLKGDPNMTDINILIQGGQMVVKSEKDDIRFIPEESGNFYKPGEKILLFVGKTTWNDYVPFAGPFGKYLIDENNNVSSIGDFRMSFKDLKAKIEEALKLPAKEHVVIPVEEMY